MAGKEQCLVELVGALKEGFKEISCYLRDSGNVAQALGSENLFGEQQLKVDVFADQCICKHLNSRCRFALSEETPSPTPLQGDHFTVTFDPLDGSSIIDTNFAVGTIVGVWDTEELIGSTGRDLVLSVIVVYGSRTTMLIEEKTDLLTKGTHSSAISEFTLMNGQWAKTKEKLTIAENTKMFAPANLRAQCQHRGYRNLLHHWADSGFTLRYSGGMVPDIYQIFIKGSGVFASPETQSAPAKLRLLYEAAPVSRLVEIAGGLAVSRDDPLLDLVIDSYEQKTGLCVGSVTEVRRFSEFMRTN